MLSRYVLRYCLNDFRVVPGAPVVNGITFVFTLLLLLLLMVAILHKAVVDD